MAVPTSLEAHGGSVDVSVAWGQEASSLVENEEVLDGDYEPEDNKDVSPASDAVPSLVLPKCALLPTEELKPVQAFVANAVCSQEDPKSRQGYRAVLDCLRKREDPPMLLKVLLSLRTAGSTLHHLAGASRRHAHLVHLIFRLDPFDPPVNTPTKLTSSVHKDPFQDFSLADAHLHLVLAMVSANSVFLTPALNAIWRLVQVEASPKRTTRLHAALATLLRLVPKGNTDLFPVLAAHFPFRTKPKAELEWYTRQCLFVTKYVPAMHHQLVELLVDKLLEIDVEIKIEDGGDVAIEDDSDLFELDMETTRSDDTKRDKETVAEKVDEMADKLDALMLILFEHIQDTTKNHAPAASLFYKMIAPVFESAVLTTHRSKFVQFTILYICGLEADSSLEADEGLPVLHDDSLSATQHSERLYRNFCSKLIDIVLDPYRATVTRQSGACYLASFLSRASYVCAETVCESLCALLRWAEAYVASIGKGVYAADARDQCEMHSLFYTVCQAAFYCMCFRGTDAVQYYRLATEYYHNSSDTKDHKDGSSPYADPEYVDISPRRWADICGHNLQPLKYCLESVRGEFLHVASVFQLLDPNLLDRLVAEDQNMASSLRKKHRASLITTATTLEMRRRAQGVGGLGRGRNPLDSFFPFDPYLLRRSHRYVQPFYKDWEGTIDESDTMIKPSVVDKLQEECSDDESQDGSKSDISDEGSCDAEVAESMDSAAYLQAMSLSSARSLVTTGKNIAFSSSMGSTSAAESPGVVSRDESQKATAREPLKRSRAPSIEHGSW